MSSSRPSRTLSHDGVLVRLRSGGRTRAGVLAATMTLSGLSVLGASPASAAVYTGEATITPTAVTSGTTTEHTIKITNKGSDSQSFGSAQVLLPTGFHTPSVVTGSLTVSGDVADSNATTEQKTWTAAYDTKDHHASQWPCPTGVSRCTKLALAVAHDKGALKPNGYVQVKVRATAPGGEPSTTWTVHGWDGKNSNSNNTFSYNTQPTVAVSKGAQAITFAALAGKTFGDAAFTASAGGGLSGNPVTFAVKNATDTCTATGTNGATVSLTGAGSCTIVASQAGNDFYNAATPVEQTFTIAKASQVITFNGLDSKKYLDPAFSVAAAATGGASGNPVTFAVKNATDKCTTGGTNGATVSLTGAGSCTIVASQAGNSNYAAATAVERTFSITKADAVLGLTNVTDTYDGSAKSATATSDPSPLEGLTVTYTLNGQPVAAPTNAGTYTVRASLDNPDYAAESVTGQLVIHPKTIAGVITVAPKVYDGGTSATISSRSLTGVIDGDAVELTGGTATYNDRHVGTKTVTGSGFTLSGGAAGNYVLDPEASITASAQITPKPITGAITAGDKVYDGTNTASVKAINPEGEFVGGDTVSLGADNGRFATVNVGAQTVTADLALAGSNAGNYSLSSATATKQANITPKDASVTPNAASTTYGAADPELTGNLSGFIAADGITASYSRTEGSDAGGTYVVSATLSPAAKLANYNITYNTAAFTIDKAATTTTVTCPSSGVTYTGSALTPCTASVTGAGNLDEPLTVTHSDNTNAGTATASASYAASANHTASSDSKTFTIAQAAGSVSISNLPADGVRVGGSFTPTYSQVGDGTASTTSKTTSVCTVGTDGKVNYIGAGTCTLEAAATASTNYTAATGADQSFRVDPSTVWTLKGFYAPIGEANSIITKKGDAVPAATDKTVWNTAKGGSTIPLKFNVAKDNVQQTSTGTDVVKSFTAAKLSSCSGTVTDGIEELSTTGSTSLRYDTTDKQYVQTWKTSTVSTNTCFRVALTTADDSVIYTFVQLRK